jgi:hypothetical protein
MVEKALPEIEHSLRKKRFLLIDAKSDKNIRNKQVSFKIFDENNCVSEYNVPDNEFDPNIMDTMSSDLNED